MKFTILKGILLDILNELDLKQNLQETILLELDGKIVDPSKDLDKFHAKLKERDLSDKFIKSVIRNTSNLNKINQLYGHAAILDYYLIFLGLKVPIGGSKWLTDNDEVMYWYKAKIHSTNYGKIAIKHKFGSTYLFKVKVAEAVEAWLFSKWRFFPDGQNLTNDDAIVLRKQICEIKNARLVIDINLLKKIFEFTSKDFFYNSEVLDFLSGYKFDIKLFEAGLQSNIDFIGCEYRRRLDDCYELIFS